ncbi:MAG: TolC family protein [Spirosomataceae bacterium]
MKTYLKYIFFVSAISANAQTKMTLKECADIAIKNNLTIREAQINAENANVLYGQAKSQAFPQTQLFIDQGLRAGRSINRFDNTFINEVYNTNGIYLQSQVSVFNSFQIKNQARQNELLYQSSLKNIDAARNRLMVNLIQAYIQVLAAQELLDVTQKQVETSKQQVERVSKQIEAGTVGNTTLFDIKSQLANDEFSFVTAKNNLQTARLTLFQQMNQSPNRSVVFEPIKEEVNLYNIDFQEVDRIYEEAATLFPDIKSNEIRIQSFDNGIKAAKANALPSLSLSGSFQAFYASSNTELNYIKQLDATRNGSLNLTLTVPILGNLQNKYRVNAVRIQKQLAENQLNTARLQLRQAIEQSFQAFIAASERYKIANEQVEILNQNVAAIESRISAGVVMSNSADYILARNNQARALSNLVQAKYEYILQKKALDFYRSGEWRF